MDSPNIKEATVDQLIDEIESRHYASIIWTYKVILNDPKTSCHEVLSFKGSSTLTRGAVSKIQDAATRRENNLAGFISPMTSPDEDR